jgi:predicted nucleic acid-binding protein
MVMVDSVVWIAYKNKRDTWHNTAKILLPKIIEQKKLIFITDYIVLEVVNFLLRKIDQKTALETFDMFLKTDKIKILHNDAVSFLATRNVMKKYQGLSFTDANIIVNMKENNLKDLCTLDSGFKVVEDINLIS